MHDPWCGYICGPQPAATRAHGSNTGLAGMILYCRSRDLVLCFLLSAWAHPVAVVDANMAQQLRSSHRPPLAEILRQTDILAIKLLRLKLEYSHDSL